MESRIADMEAMLRGWGEEHSKREWRVEERENQREVRGVVFG